MPTICNIDNIRHLTFHLLLVKHDFASPQHLPPPRTFAPLPTFALTTIALPDICPPYIWQDTTYAPLQK